MEPKQDKIKDPIAKLENRQISLSLAIFSRIDAIGNDIKKGTCTKKKCDRVFKIVIKPKLKPFKCKINKLPLSKSS